MNTKKSRNSSGMDLSILEAAVENTNEAFVTIREDSTVLFFNKAAERIFGYRREEVLGRSLELILGPGCREGHLKAVNRYLQSRQPTLIGHATEFDAMRKNGKTFPASISFSVTEIDKRLFFTGIIRDLTEERELQQQVIRNERLAALGQAVAEITHEIKNPLVMIGGFARQLVKRAEDDVQQTKLTTIVREVDRLERLLAELKDLYRPRDLRIAQFDLNDLLREIASLAMDSRTSENISIRLADEAPHAFIDADREKIKQVLLNVIKNSMEAMREGGEIIISSECSGDKITLKIIDNGPGIPEEILDKIFSPFFTTKEGGTGLGLCVSKRIIEEHPGSSFAISSQPGHGVEVVITLSGCRIVPLS